MVLFPITLAKPTVTQAHLVAEAVERGALTVALALWESGTDSGSQPAVILVAVAASSAAPLKLQAPVALSLNTSF